MALLDDIRQGWSDHAGDPEGVAQRFDGWVSVVAPAERAALAGLLVHVMGEHLARYAEGLRLLTLMDPDQSDEAVLRSRAVMMQASGDIDGAEGIVSALPAPRGTHEARVLAIAGAIVAAHGALEEGGRWLVRAASMTYGLADADPAVRAVAITANNLAVSLENALMAGANEPDKARLLRVAAGLARASWERAGTWIEVERAEYRLASAHLVLKEPEAACTHAEACALICLANGASALESLFAYEIQTRSWVAVGNRAQALASLARARASAAQVLPDDAAYAAEGLARAEQAVSTASA